MVLDSDQPAELAATSLKAAVQHQHHGTVQKPPLCIEKIGDGPALVFLHGWMMRSTCWDSLAQNLAADYQLCLIDLPGHGKNTGCKYSLSQPEPFVHRLLSELPKNAIWIGWSLGGLLAQLAALADPAHVKALVSISMGTSFEPGADETFDRLCCKTTGTDHALLYFIALQTLGSSNARVTRKLLKASASLPEKNGLDFLKKTDLYAAMKQCTVPALFINGTHDQVTNPATVRTSVDSLPYAQYAEIPGAGHAPFLSHPEIFTATLRHFFCHTGHFPHG